MSKDVTTFLIQHMKKIAPLQGTKDAHDASVFFLGIDVP